MSFPLWFVLPTAKRTNRDRFFTSLDDQYVYVIDPQDASQARQMRTGKIDNKHFDRFWRYISEPRNRGFRVWVRERGNVWYCRAELRFDSTDKVYPYDRCSPKFACSYESKRVVEYPHPLVAFPPDSANSGVQRYVCPPDEISL